ncbi:hypothetical protein cypCar_00037307 [Cyprinus carpio]|nr:hypothetical protein cypCar_00037307 [Cyprinus carpio]
MMETRDGDGERRQGHTESRGDPQVISVEKQNSLITLAWSNHIQEDIRYGEFTFSETQRPEQTLPTDPQLLQNTDMTDTNTAPASVHFPDTQTFASHEMEASLQEQRNEEVCEEQQLQREATMRSLVHIQRRAERRWQRDRDRQLLRVQERLAIVQSQKTDEDLRLRHLIDTLRQEDEQQQKTLVREKLQQMRRERSCILQTRRER